jgi:two-component system nitrogen regulation response regulator NtrX
VGGEKTIETDVRIVAATNHDLEKACAQGLFRQDLYFRLNVIPIHIPPLRERTDDIPLLLYHFLQEMEIENLRLEDDAMDLLCSHDWPGNVRELKNLAERIAVMHSGDNISREALTGLLNKGSGVNSDKKNRTNLPAGNAIPEKLLEHNFNDAKELFEKHYLEFHFLRNNGIISRTANAIGIYPSNLHTKLKKYGIAAQATKEE